MLVVVFFLSTRYHSNACYKPYLLQADRNEKGEMKIDIEIDTTEAENDDIMHSTQKLKRRKSDDSTVTKLKSKKMFRLCEVELFMKATKFNLDSVHTRICIYNSKEKLFAADMYSHS